jgi:hypothetical protein
MTVVEQARKAQESAVATAKDLQGKAVTQAKVLQGEAVSQAKEVRGKVSVQAKDLQGKAVTQANVLQRQLRDQVKSVDVQEILDDVQGKVTAFELPTRDEVTSDVAKAREGLGTLVTSLVDRVKVQIRRLGESAEAPVVAAPAVESPVAEAAEPVVTDSDDEAQTA